MTLTEEQAYNLVQFNIERITNDLRVKTTERWGENCELMELTTLKTVALLVNKYCDKFNSDLYFYFRNNWEHFQEIGCTQRSKYGKYEISYRTIIELLTKYGYELQPTIETMNEVLVPSVDIGGIDVIIDSKIELLTKKKHELEERLKQVNNALTALTILGSVDSLLA
ncbi:hypothetical protein [Scytonema sp. NUACC26]|uniref:hypothetical protein n=1 Tax=Scytonema sp. NUACC26 TaxID=3140176 RepID=UPI0034DC6F97